MNLFKRGVEMLRQPDRNPRCYEMTAQERINRVQQLYNEKPSNTTNNRYPDISTTISTGARHIT
jgi:hypothetical protein